MAPRSWLAGTIVVITGATIVLMACGPEASRSRDGGLGGSSRRAAPPTVVSDPSLVVQPTMNIPYATPGALPTLRPAIPAGTPPGNPVATANPTPQQPGAGSPTPTR